MRKSTIIVKRTLALFLVVLMSINTFGAVVSDNDGSAFITKAEFDSLKNDFQSQIDQYNTSIDAKIDGAIASYLSGISITKQMVIDPLVKDYENLKWKRKWEIKGSYKYYPTHRTTDRQYYEDIWYVPHYQDIVCLNKGMQFDLVKMRVRGGVIANLYGDWNRNSSVRVKYGFPVLPRFALSADPRFDDEIILMDGTAPGVFDSYGGQKILLAKGGSLERLHGQVDVEDEPYAYYSGTWNQGDYREWGEKSWAPVLDGASYPPLENLTLTENQVLNIYIYANMDNHRDWAVRRWHVVISGNEVEPYQSYYDRSMEQFWDGYISDTDIENGDYSTNFWSKPAYFDIIKSGSAAEQKDDLLDLMLGKDFDWDAPLLRVDANVVRSGGYKHMVTTYSPWGNLTMDVKEVKIGGTTPWTADAYNNVEYSTTYPVTWRVPSLEKYDFKKITSGKYVFNGNKLKFGQGLPIVQSASADGRLLVEFDYDIGRTVDTMPTSTNGIDIDIKKNDFLTADGSFYSGLVNDNDSLSILHNLGINETSKHVKIVIENVARDDNIWLRIAPHDTDGGLYAQMANLKTTLITE